jgi:hypothetical protein
MRFKGEEALMKILDLYRNKGGKYDCIVGVSGGRDSSFILYNLAKKYGMRVLAYNYDNGFTSEDAERNLRNTINKLNVDLVQIKSEIQAKILRRNLLAWARNSRSEFFPQLCYGCALGSHGGAYKVARENDIPLLITGRSQVERIEFRRSVLFSHSPVSKLAYEYKLTPMNWFLKAVRNPFYLDPRALLYYVRLSIEFPTSGWKIGGEETFKGLQSDQHLKVIKFFDFIDHNQEDTSLIEKELGWRKSTNLSSSWRFDCKIHALKTFLEIKKLGFSETTEMLSRMIRNGLINREEALRRVDQEKHDINKLLVIADEVFDEINLPKKYRDRIINCP